MLRASLKMELGSPARDFIRILDRKVRYKRSRVNYRANKRTLEITVEASDPSALVSSLNGTIKQLRIVTSVDKVVSEEE